MIDNLSLEAYCNNILNSDSFSDYCPNGLQVEGAATIRQIACAVSVSQDVISQAINDNVEALFVHHGFFWKNEPLVIRGMKKRRLQLLLENDINCYAYHLPLDCHPDLGNNAELARILGIEVTKKVSVGGVDDLLWVGRLKYPTEGERLKQELNVQLQREPLWVCAQDARDIQTLAWCSGGAQGYLSQAKTLGVDAYLSGEASEMNYYQAKELNIHYFGAGHHATERYGIQALGKHLAEAFDLQYRFYDIDNPI